MQAGGNSGFERFKAYVSGLGAQVLEAVFNVSMLQFLRIFLCVISAPFTVLSQFVLYPSKPSPVSLSSFSLFLSPHI